MPKINREEYEYKTGAFDWATALQSALHGESEGSEVKNIEWVKGKIERLKEINLDNWKRAEPNSKSQSHFYGSLAVIDKALDFLNELDEPEVLSGEWIDKNSILGQLTTSEGLNFDKYVKADKLKNLLVPKQELPLIPQFVADILKSKTFDSLSTAFIELFSANAADFYGEEICEWIGSNEELFAKAWLAYPNIEVEEEQKYYVINNDNRMMLVRMMDGKTITEADPFKLEGMYEVEKKSHRLTEQEIKDYDERYWPFAKPVEGLEE